MDIPSIVSIGGGIGAPVAASTSFGSTSLLLSPLLEKCAISAQQKQKRNARHGDVSGVGQKSYYGDDRLNEVFGVSNPPENALLLNNLPVLQTKYDHIHRRGALLCRSGTWLELIPHHHYTSSRRRRDNWEEEWSEEDEENDEDDSRARRGYVRGTRKENSPFSVLEFLAVAFGLISIRGVHSHDYLCMDRRGKLYASPAANYTAECVFMEEMLENYYNLYSSCLFGTRKRPWYVALRRTGRPKLGRLTRRRQKTAHFLVVRFGDNGNENDEEATVLREHTGSKVHPDELPSVVDRWKAYYSLDNNATTSANKTEEVVIRQLGSGGRISARLTSVTRVQPTSTPTHTHRIRHHKSIAHPPLLSDDKYESIYYKGPTRYTHSASRGWRNRQTPTFSSWPYKGGQKNALATNSWLPMVNPLNSSNRQRRLRRLEREERRRVMRKLELEELRKTTMRTNRASLSTTLNQPRIRPSS